MEIADLPFNIATLQLNKKFAKETIFQTGRNPTPMREYANRLKVIGFIQNQFGITFQGNPRYEWMTTSKTELDQQKLYCDLYDRDGEYYKTAHSLSKLKWGRTNPANNLSLSIFHRPTRHAYCKGIYRDKDMKNAHISFLCEIFKNREDIDISALQEYAKNPKYWREQVAIHHGLDPIKDKDIAKQLFIRLVFGGEYDTWIKDYDIEHNIQTHQRFTLAVQMEMQLEPLRELFYKANPKIVEDLKKHDKVKYSNIKKLKRSVMAFSLQTIERWIMEACIRFLIEEKNFDLRDIIPCQDGMMILEKLNYVGMEDDFNRIIKEQFKMDIEWTDKPFDEAIEIPDGIIEKTYEQWMRYLSDSGMADKLLDYHKNRVLMSPQENRVYVFDPISKRWYDDESTAERKLKNMIESLHQVIETEIFEDCSINEKERNSFILKAKSLLLDNSGISNIRKRVLDKAGWIECGFNSISTQFGFENGWIDLTTNTFQEYTENVYITQTTGYSWIAPNYENKEINNDSLGMTDIEVRDKLIQLFADQFNWDKNGDISPENCPELFYYIMILASCLDRVNYQHIWFFRGSGGNGKSLGTGMLETALGNIYSTSCDGSILKEDSKKANQASEDIFKLKDARMGVFAEIDKSGAMTWSSIKTLTGGDKMHARQIYSKVCSFYLTASFICVFNQNPDFIGSMDAESIRSLARRLRVLEFIVRFATSEEDLKEQKAKDKKSIWKLGNSLYISPEWRKRAKFVLLDFLFGFYAKYYKKEISALPIDDFCPISVKQASKMYLEEEDVFSQIFEELYEKNDEFLEDAFEIEKIYDYKTKKEINRRRYINRIYIKDLWNSIESHSIYKEKSNGEGKKQFIRSYNRKAFSKWIETKFDIHIDSVSKIYYILGCRQLGEDINDECETICTSSEA